MDNQKYLLGWKEWITLPLLGIDKIKCKVDTGAKTSALHAFYIDPFTKGGKAMIHFGLHPNQDDTQTVLHCEAEVFDQRIVTSSNGDKDMRYVIKTEIVLGKHTKEIELTLTNRDTMKFRMLLGRRAMDGLFIVDPELAYQNGKSIN